MTHHLQIEHLFFTYPGSFDPVFSDLSLQFYRGWSGIVGANGSGKSTLMQLIGGILKPDSGTIRQGEYALYCEQRTDTIPEDFLFLMESYDGSAIRLRESLGIKEDWAGRWESLSHGERKRAQIAAALYRDPPLLLLDEPTNHLDAPSKALLFKALERYRGVGLLISHDRAFLDGLCRHTLFLAKGEADMRHNPYSVAKAEREKEMGYHREQVEQQDREIKKLKRQVRVQRQKADRSDGRVSKRHIDPKDIDAKKKIELAVLTGKDATDGKILERYKSRLTQAQDKRGEICREFATGIVIKSGEYRRLFPITIEPGVLTVGEECRVQFPRLVIAGGEKIGITGSNGSGKSSFIRYLVRNSVWPSGALLYIPQEIGREESEALMARVRALDTDIKGELMALIVRLGSDPSLLLQSALPSPGETRKLMLALGMAEHPGLIIMDEPTNHMDLIATESLESALQAYDGAVLLVSHDRIFLEHVTTREWHFLKDEGHCRITERDMGSSGTAGFRAKKM